MKKFALAVLLILLTNLYLFSQNPFTHYRQAYKYYEQERYEEAIGEMNQFMKLSPGNVEGFYLRGFLKYELYGMDSAHTDLRKAAINGHHMSADLLSNYKKFGFLMPTTYRNTIFLSKKVSASNPKSRKFSPADHLRGAMNPQRECYDVTFYDLQVKMDTSSKIEGVNKIYFKALKPSKVIQVDLFKNMKIHNALLDNSKVKYKRKYNAILISFPDSLVPGKSYQLTIEYSGSPQEAIQPPWEGGFVRKKDRDGNHWRGVACERLGASLWWPNKDHLSDEPDSMKISLIVPNIYTGISNGNLIKEEDLSGDLKKNTWLVKNPINNYNVTYYMGNFVNFKDTLFRKESKLDLDYYVLSYNLAKAKKHFKQVQEVLAFYEEAFGEYPFPEDGFGMVESPFAGMEHQGAIAYGSEYGSKDTNRYHNKKYDYIIVHEAAHEWWGNSVSVGDMADAWIHEGFATYAELIFLERIYGYEEYMLELVKRRKQIHNLFSIVGRRNVNDNTFATGDIYYKGANLLDNFRCTLDNDTLFFKIIKSFALENKKKIVDTDTWIEHVNKSTGKDWKIFFSPFLYKAELPVLEYKVNQTGSTATLEYRWADVEPGFEMPFGVVLNREKGERLLGSTTWQKKEFENVTQLDVPQGWHPYYKFLPRNTFTYFTGKKIVWKESSSQEY